MSQQEFMPRPQRREEEQLADMAQPESLDASIDGLLDEIDSVLETNATDFVQSFVQKGGQ